jgi:hypothetical protein
MERIASVGMFRAIKGMISRLYGFGGRRRCLLAAESVAPRLQMGWRIMCIEDVSDSRGSLVIFREGEEVEIMGCFDCEVAPWEFMWVGKDDVCMYGSVL